MQLLLYICLLLSTQNPPCYSYTVGDKDVVKMYWKDDAGKPIGNFVRLISFLKNEKLVFATNGGMYHPDQSPVGLFIQEGKLIKPINKVKGSGNFGIQPNGIFYITNDNKAGVCKTGDFSAVKVKYATQSGPMLVVDGNISPAIISSTTSLYIRNGVGILPNGKTIFAISKSRISFHDFAKYFKDLGCKNALYFDGAISQMYPFLFLPRASFGVIVAISKS